MWIILIFSYVRPLSMAHMQFWPHDLSFGSFGVMRGRICFCHSVWIENNRTLRMAPMCCSRRDASTGMLHDLFGFNVTTCDLDLRSSFIFIRSTFICFDAYASICICFICSLMHMLHMLRREKHYNARFSPQLFFISYSRKNTFWWKPSILTFMTCVPYWS